MIKAKILFATAVSLLLAACAPQDRQSELCDFEPRGTTRFTLAGEPGLQLDNAIRRVFDATRPADSKGQRAHCGITLSAQENTDDSVIAAAVRETLGAGWQYREDLQSTDAQIKIHLWQHGGGFWPAQYYALAAYRDTLHDTAGKPFRPIYSLYLRDSDSGLHGAVVFGTIMSAMVLPFAALAYFMRRRRKARRT